MPIDPTIFDQLLRVSALLERDLARTLAPSGLSSARMHVLWVVHHDGPRSQQQLAIALDVTPRNITGLVDALADSGLVSREPHPTDRRVVLVTLTPAGERLVADAARDQNTVSGDLLAAVPAADRDAFTRGLAAVVERLESLVTAGERGR